MAGIDGLQEMIFVRVYSRDWMRTYLRLELVKENGTTCILSESDASSLTEWGGVTLEGQSG